MKKKRKYIYLEKFLIIRILQIYIFSFYDFLFFISLSDAKFTKNISKYFIGRNLSGYFSKIMHALSYVLSQEISGNTRM